MASARWSTMSSLGYPRFKRTAPPSTDGTLVHRVGTERIIQNRHVASSYVKVIVVALGLACVLTVCLPVCLALRAHTLAAPPEMSVWSPHFKKHGWSEGLNAECVASHDLCKMASWFQTHYSCLLHAYSSAHNPESRDLMTHRRLEDFLPLASDGTPPAGKKKHRRASGLAQSRAD